MPQRTHLPTIDRAATDAVGSNQPGMVLKRNHIAPKTGLANERKIELAEQILEKTVPQQLSFTAWVPLRTLPADSEEECMLKFWTWRVVLDETCCGLSCMAKD